MTAKSLSKAMVDYSTAFLIWLFSIFLFIPLAEAVPTQPPLYPIVSFIIFVAIFSLVAKATSTFIEFIGWITGVLEKRGKMEKARLVKFILFEVLIIIDSVLVIPLLWLISPIFGGIALIFAIMAVLATLSVYSTSISEALVEKILG